MADDPVECDVVQAKVLVAVTQALRPDRQVSTEQHVEELPLVPGQHESVGAVEVAGKQWITEDALVEPLDDGSDGVVATHTIGQGCRRTRHADTVRHPDTGGKTRDYSISRRPEIE